jgi:Na+/H+ antiporter NhaD/arsenite permease-like protein
MPGKYKFKILLVAFITIIMFCNKIFAGTLSGNSFINTLALSGNLPVKELPSFFMLIPFVLLLVMIATGPLFYKHFWEKHYPKISIFLGLIIVVYYIFILENYYPLVHTLSEYISFIALLSSLFVASGGILIKVDRKSTPFANVIFLLFGAVISNIIGTTGASMLLIRPYLRMNKDRISPYHIIFFIFIVSNIGGALTPIGDPPLFLGFLSGVPFFWVIKNVWAIWFITILLILLAFYFFDLNNKKESTKHVEYSGKIHFKGLRNLFYLAIIVVSVFIDPQVITWVPSLYPLPFGIREIIMFSVVFFSYKTADMQVLKDNEFDFEPIKEVAYLFVGIFATMIPALQIIAEEAKVFGDKLSAGIFYWASGGLSAVLDNTPTYMNFLSAAMGKYSLNVANKAHVLKFVEVDDIYLKAISVAAVFFGAMTYIGNGPNFMVKSISERAGIIMPSFFNYIIRYSVIILLPIFTVIWLLFFTGRTIL